MHVVKIPAAPEAGTPDPGDGAKANQSFGTSGIVPMGRPSPGTRVLMAIVSCVERVNFRFARFGNPPVYAPETFAWTAAIEEQWTVIRSELDRILVRKVELPSFQSISRDVATISSDEGWKTFFLCGYGRVSERNVAQCPETWRILQGVPGLRSAMFSIFEPGKHLPAHRGPYNGVLRLHLGLKVDEVSDRLAIRVGDTVCHWQEGRVLVFDDAFEHEAWNHTQETRVVLFVDFDKPLRWPASLFNRIILGVAAFTPFIREGAENHAAWEERFYRDSKSAPPTGPVPAARR